MRSPSVFAAVALTALLPFAPVGAGPGTGDDQEIEMLEQALEETLDEAREWEAKGWESRAADLFRRAEEIERKLAALRARPAGPDDLLEILEGLERGLDSLERLEAWDAHEVVARVAEDVRAMQESFELEREGSSLEHLHELLRLAVKVSLEDERPDLADQVEHFLHARELEHAGRPDEEARHVIETAPHPGHVAEILHHCANWLDRHQRRNDAWELRELAAHLVDRRHVEEELRALELALHAFREAEKHDGADLLERALHARRMKLEGRTDPEAMSVRERAPRAEQVLDLMVRAEDLWREWGHEDRARAISAATERFAERRHRAPDDVARRLAELEERVHHLSRSLAEVSADLKRLREQVR